MLSIPKSENFKYIYNLPYIARVELCNLLNNNNQWEELAGKWMQYDVFTIQRLRREDNPTDKLLTLWSIHNHTILELFVLLKNIKQHQGIKLLRPFVEDKYYWLLESRDDILNRANSLPQVPFEELTLATNGWDDLKIIGKGGFGIVYRATWKNTEVAIKKLKNKNIDNQNKALEQSLKEIKILHSRPHENILVLYAFSISGETPCLVYQFMANGSLEDWLLLRNQRSPALTWLQRYEIIKGVTKGLQYLHTIDKKPLIHGDIKSANILLGKNFEPRIGDFGLVKEGPTNGFIKVSRPQGTRPYLPEEFLKNKILSTKVDVYSYGIVCLEVVTGLSAYDSSKGLFLRDYVNIWIDQNVSLQDIKAGDENVNIFYHLLTIGMWCSTKVPIDRPEMELVFKQLDDF
ncbi:pelle-like serine/threonine-protein kinase pik-1 [Microplitis mediator]|uniref:pelle-like serine/threonine-protein kinase pik-1 n=1 Tax=Microplitis mediator TaxID=375433 RepID=UPI002554C098|nr:pelle-like serine/threonine-protein kinase pik-1 [Microplitis mediator]XP_057325537.1 pelle-like serine/threonine-protein kinase pik-1 [Microplitis mediator]